jgi:FG-GAP repeat
VRTTAHRGLLAAIIGIVVALTPAAAAAAPLVDQFGAAGGPQYTFGSGAGTPNLVASGDFNGDGVPDLAVGTFSPGSGGHAGEVSVLLGNVSEVATPHGLPKQEFTGFTPSPGSPIAVGTAPSAVVTGDFTGNGHTDIAVLGSTGTGLTIYLGDGKGDFTVAPGSPISVTGALAVGKFATGKPDEIAAVDGNTVSVIGDNGSGQFATLKTSNLKIPDSAEELAATAGAFANNANVDLAVLDGSTGNVEVLLGGGGGGFSVSSASPVKSGLNGPGCSGSVCLFTATSITTGNFNGDAHSDLAIGTADGHVATLLGTGSVTGTFTVAPGSPYAADPSGDEIAQVVAAPFGSSTEDGIATANYFQGGCEEPCALNTDSVSVMLPTGNGALAAASGSPYADGGVTYGVAAGDFNQDGLTDVAFLDANDCQGNAIGVMLNYGTTGTPPSGGLYPADRCTIPQPVVTTAPATGVSLTGATLNGSVDPNFQQITTCEFQYELQTGGRQAPWTSSSPTAQCKYPGKPRDLSVSAQVSGLKSLSTYQYRLEVITPNGTFTGATRTIQTCSYPQVTLDSGVVATGCFSEPEKGVYSSTGNADVSGIEFEPRHGGVTLSSKDDSLSAKGPGLMMVAGFLPVPWAPNLSMDLSGDFTVGPHVNFAFGGFRVEGQLEGSVLPGGEMQLTADTSMNILGSPIEATIGIVTYNDTDDQKPVLSGAAVGVGPADADPLDPSTLMYCNPKFKKQPAGFDCNPYPATSNDPVYRLTPKGENPENQTETDPNNMPYCSLSKAPPVGYKCEMVEDKGSRLGQSPRLIALNPGVVKLAGFLPLEGIGFSYDSNGGTWMGSATIDLNGLFPGEGRFSATDNTTLQVNLTIGTNPFQFDSGGFALNGAIALTPAGDDGPELTNASFNLMLHPSFDIGGSLGVVIKSGASISGGFNLSLGNSSGFDLSVNGNITTAAGIGWSGNARFDDEDGGLAGELGGSFTRNFGPVSLTVGLDGAMEFEPHFHWQLAANGTASAFGQDISVQGIVSDAGIGLCGTAHVLIGSVSVGFTWTHQNGFNWSGCDFSGLETVSFATSPDGAHAAAASRTIRVAHGTAREEFAAVGADGPPAVTLTGPGGATLSTPTTENRLEVSRSGLAIAVSDSRTTFFVVEHPAAGSWHLSPEAGQPGPARYEVAAPLAPLDLKATVTGSGRHRSLRWRMHAQHGQTVQFLQLGGAGEPITITSSGRGRARFTVAPGPGGRREIVAVVSIDGVPQRKLTVARFHVAAPRGPAVTHATYSLNRGTLKVGWRRAGDVAHYEVDVTLRRGLLSFMFRPSSSSAKLMLPPGAKLRRVTVSATGKSGIIGKSVAARLTRVKRHKRHRHR